MDHPVTYCNSLYKLYSTYFSFLHGKRIKENRIFSPVVCGRFFSHSRSDLSLWVLLSAVLFTALHDFSHPLYDDCRFIPHFGFRIFERRNFVRKGSSRYLDNTNSEFLLAIVRNTYKFKGTSRV